MSYSNRYIFIMCAIRCYLFPTLIFVILLVTACELSRSPKPSTNTSAPTFPPTLTEETLIYTPTPIPIPSNTPIKLKNTETPIPKPTSTPLPSFTPVPSSTPYGGVIFRNDQMQVLDAQTITRINLERPHLIILNINDRSSSGSLATALPDSELAVLYYVDARNPGILRKIQELHASALGNIYPSRDGSSLVYLEENLTDGRSLYVLSLREGFRLRILSLIENIPRGIPIQPSWSPDASEFAVAIATDYEMDIYAFELAKNQWRALTRGGGYDFHPVWSPDGRYIAYLSDTARCSSWQPSSPDSCNRPDAIPPRQGQLHILDLRTDSVKRINDLWFSEPPHWLDDETIAYISGDPTDRDSERMIWISDVLTARTRPLFPRESKEIPSPQDVFWSSDGNALIYQGAGEENRMVVAKADGTILGSSDELNFPRYGMSADWAPDGSRLAIGGVAGQCPYGTLVFTRDLQLIAQGVIPPMCEPRYSPDGNYLAFEGVNSRLDGRIHVYLASPNGYSAINLTEDLRGQNRLIGWAIEP